MPDHIWRRSASAEWLRANEPRLEELASHSFAVIEWPRRKRIQIEASCTRASAAKLRQAFGGAVELIPRDWLARAQKSDASKPLRVGRRLLVSREPMADARTLVIPAGAAFGTGEHATTAMSLRMLERVTRGLTSDWRMLDAGTGSGILALAGRRFGARSVLALDNDPLAVSTAKANARANEIRGVKFACADVTKLSGGSYEIITANLFSELLISVLPFFRRSLSPRGWLVLSGVLRTQERELQRALRGNRFEIHETRRRGKWIALRAQGNGTRRSFTGESGAGALTSG